MRIWDLGSVLELHSGIGALSLRFKWPSLINLPIKVPVKLLPMDQFSNKVSFDAQGAYFSAISRPLYMTTNAETGEELWSHKLPYIGSAPPTSYEINGEQYIVIPASGGTTLKMYYGNLVEQGDAVVAFKIKN